MGNNFIVKKNLVGEDVVNLLNFYFCFEYVNFKQLKGIYVISKNVGQ